MKLQILVPQYKETDEVIKPLLDSIAIQQNVPMDEIGVIICNDGSDVKLTDEFLAGYPFKIEYYQEEHRGVSATRNACLDRATADYVMFIGRPIEEWKDIHGYEGMYKISSYGRVYSAPRRGSKGGFIRPSYSGSGYLSTHLCKNGISCSRHIHRIVAEHFIQNPNQYPEVNHIDESKENNCVWNLEFCTRVYNQNYGTAIERATKSHDYAALSILSAKHHDYKEVGRKQAKPVLQMSRDGHVIRRWDSIREAARQMKCSCGNISSACHGKIKTVSGYRWEFEREAI